MGQLEDGICDVHDEIVVGIARAPAGRGLPISKEADHPKHWISNIDSSIRVAIATDECALPDQEGTLLDHGYHKVNSSIDDEYRIDVGAWLA